MATLRCVARLNVQRFTLLCLLQFMFVFVIWLWINPYKSVETNAQDKSYSTSETASMSTILKKAFVNGFLVAKKKNLGKTTGSAVCVADPAIIECNNVGFAAFLLFTLDHIIFCRSLGIHRATVDWRACNSVCSRDPTVNSWDWYFEPLNRGLESKVENVLCPLMLDGVTSAEVERIIDNSFKNRSDVGGFESSRIISTQERMRVNKLMEQYVKPNSRIKEKVRMFYQRYLAGFTVLGIHVRGTDHWSETSEKRLPSLMSWVKRARSILETLPRPRKVFIASDNDEVIKKFVNSFGKETVIFTKAFRSEKYHDEMAPHAFKFKHNAAEPHERELGTQVLMDILLLAKCDHFLHTESSVASLASYFNPHMTSYFLQEEENSVKQPKQFGERRVTNEATRKEELTPLEENEVFIDMLECLQRNSAGSACPVTEKGIFFSFQEAQAFWSKLHPIF